MVSTSGNEGDRHNYITAVRVGLRTILPWLVAAVVFTVLFLIAEHNVAPKFRHCVADVTKQQTAKGSERNGQSIASLASTQTICTISLVNRDADFFALLGTIAVAGFTLTLWRSTDKLWREGRSQRDTLDRQTKILEKQLSIQNPYLGFDKYNTVIRRRPDNHSVLEGYRISLSWKNTGNSVATNTKYWIGQPSFVEGTISPEAIALATELFQANLFRTEGSPGYFMIAPGGSYSTDEVVLMPDQLRGLSNGFMVVWCIARYGSRLEMPNWFAEVAILLGFSLIVNPDRFGITEAASGDAFRVATLGYRYRESYD